MLCDPEPSKKVPKPAPMVTDEDGHRVKSKRNLLSFR